MDILYIIVGSTIGGTLGAFLGRYWGKRGETSAIKKDFAEIKEQLKETTKAVKSVESEIAHKDWQARELKTLKRIKLEELLEDVHGAEAWLRAYTKELLSKKGEAPERDPLVRAGSIANLYFSELVPIINEYGKEHQKAIGNILDCYGKIIKGAEQEVKHLEEFATRDLYLRKDRIAILCKLDEEARKIVSEIIGAPAPDAPKAKKLKQR